MALALPSSVEIARRLGGEVSGPGQIVAPGPNHSPVDRSLSVKVDPRSPEGYVVHSFADDDPIVCRDYVRNRLGLGEWRPNGGARLKTVSKIVAEYDYRDEDGNLLFQVVRFEPKDFRQRRPDGNGGWHWKLGDVRRVPYRLPELVKAVAADSTIYIVEGEKAVDALARLGLTATCSPHGAGKWREEYSSYLNGADVVILPDNDVPGELHGQAVARSLANVAVRVRVLRLAGEPDGGDVYDWLKAGGTAEQLAQATELADEWKIEAKKPKANGHAEGFQLVCIADVEPTPVDWLWPGYLAIGKLTLLGGDPDLGKSLICTDAAARQSKGINWPRGPRSRIGSTIFICSEDGIADTIRPRAESAGADLDMLHVFESTMIKDGKRRTFSLQDDLDMLGAAVDRLGNARLVCIDAITSYMGKIDSHRTTDVRAVLEPIASFAESHKVAVLGVTHPPKAAQGNALRAFTGSFAFVAAPRVAFFVTSEPETERRLLLPVKNNIGVKALGLGYHIGTKTVTNGIVAPNIMWSEEPVDVTADQAIAASNAALGDGGSMKEAKEFLRDLLANGRIDAKDGEEAAEANGIAERTLKRAKKELGVKSEKNGFDGGWTWALP
jgi:putative DNA primase/helicase